MSLKGFPFNKKFAPNFSIQNQLNILPRAFLLILFSLEAFTSIFLYLSITKLEGKTGVLWGPSRQASLTCEALCSKGLGSTRDDVTEDERFSKACSNKLKH